MRRLLGLLVAALAGLLLVVVMPAVVPIGGPVGVPAPSADAAVTSRLVPSGGPYYGPILDWTKDGAKPYAARLGATPALLGQSVRYPLSTSDDTYLTQFVQQVSTLGGLALLDVDPTPALSTLTAKDAAHLGARLAQLHADYGTDFYVRFAPEMNGSWKTWGQQPEAYVHAFRVVAAAVHRALPRTHAVMVWSPSYGAGYPFTRALGKVPGSGPRPKAQLDTNGDGVVNDADDAYAPYFPGAASVDWVGLSLYDYGVGRTYSRNELPTAGRYAAELAGTYGYSTTSGAGRAFVTKYATAAGHPMLVETGALFDTTAAAGPGQLAIKQSWWRQVFARSVQQRYPRIGAIAWLEQRRTEQEADGAVVDWRATANTSLATALRADLHADGLTLGPVLSVHDQSAGNAATAQSAGTSAGDPMGWIVLCATLLLVLFVLSGIVLRVRPSWRYPDDDKPRDRRLDLFRGWIIVAVVVTHIEVAGPYSYVTLNAIGAISGAEMFVLLSGLVLGMVYPIAVSRLGAWGAAKGALRRAAKLYLTAVAIVLAVFALSYVPGLNTHVITTFTDRGTGANGLASDGRVYDLYPNAAHLLDYPPPWYVVRDLLLLRIGPWPINILGLFVVLTLLVPALVWLLRKRLWWLVLAVSWTLYLLDRGDHIRVFHAQFEDAFPLLTWQLVFMHGIVIGFYRRQLVAALRRGWGLAATSAFVVAYAGGLGVLWLVHRGTLSVPGVHASWYQDLYEHGYVRVFLQPGRLLDLLLMLIVAYAFLTAFWVPVSRLFGWFYEPLGQHSLYVFIVHVAFVLAVGNIPHLDRHSAWQGFLVHTVALAIIWVMVRKKFLFKVIPT